MLETQDAVWLLEEILNLRRVLKRVQWAGRREGLGGEQLQACPACGNYRPIHRGVGLKPGPYGIIDSAIGHKPDCYLADELREDAD
jgi:hypothetical protein